MASFQQYKTKTGYKWLFKMGVGIDPKTGNRKTTTRRGFKTKKKLSQPLRNSRRKLIIMLLSEMTSLLRMSLKNGGMFIPKR
ncbi:Arm DNA-binding domain-containing protein [Bacillus licheniformis]